MSGPAEPAAMIVRNHGAQDPVALLDGVPLTPDEAEYVEADPGREHPAGVPLGLARVALCGTQE